ncbi:hypothetical protein E2C01_066936 [Portunus trituberculatus]|uniref:Uncharacterized protein n=1 Tax=Portunus trituberculatus TaxID=210409 RepID=A0A5B7HW48_PORTR|nr:hypothetical protein [Portunus trituberculatus]
MALVRAAGGGYSWGGGQIMVGTWLHPSEGFAAEQNTRHPSLPHSSLVAERKQRWQDDEVTVDMGLEE